MRLFSSVPAAIAVAVVVASATVLPSAAEAQDGRREAVALEWREVLQPGARLYLRNLNGAIRVEAGTGDRAEVVARKRWRRGNPDDVRVEARRVSGGRDAIICAFWTADASCDESGYRTGRNNRSRNNNNDNDVSVEFVVRLPRGVHLDLSTVNGGLTITDVTGEVEAATVNGSITASSLAGPVQARTVNGSLRVSMGDAGTGDLSYRTVNGSVTLELPDGFNGRLSMSTVNGSLQSDFPLTVQGRLNPKRIETDIGSGGRRLEVSTVNGSVKLLNP